MPKAPAGPVPVVVMGLGFIGQEIARAALQCDEVELLGAVDKSPLVLGRPLAQVLGAPAAPGVVKASLAEAVGKRRNAVLLHATGSRLPQVMDQISVAVDLGLSVVSTCEELAFPWLNHRSLAEKLDRDAQRKGVSVLGTGVNPGFVLDRLVATLAQVTGRVRRISASRVVDARTRREGLQRKIGAELDEDAFLRLVDQDQIGHIGLCESAALCALGAGLDCDDFEEEIVPVLATEDITGGAFVVRKGRVAGIQQTAVGLCEGQEKVRLELTIAIGADSPADRIEIEADSTVSLVIPGGLAGDRATANLVVNAAPRLAAAEPGLLTVLELPAGR